MPSQPTVRRVAELVRDPKGKDHPVFMWIRCSDRTVVLVESQSEPAGYEWAGEASHRCSLRDVFPNRACRHIQAVRQYQAQRSVNHA